MIEQIITRALSHLQRRKIRLTIDLLLQCNIAQRYRCGCPIDFDFTLFDLIYAVGICRTVASTKSNKIPFYAEFLQIFTTNDRHELRVSLDEDRFAEQKQEISRYVGEGLSLVVAEKLYALQKSTITRIRRKGNASKPDFMGLTPLLKVVWEAKGSMNAISQKEITHAKAQKAKEPADIAFASLATLKSESVTEVRLEDPPALPLRGTELEQQRSRIRHYVNTFNFIGQTELSRYFELLGKRLEKDRNFPEFGSKIELFERIKTESIKITIKERSYLGNVERLGDSTFLYTGFDESLLSVQDFLSFGGYEDFVFEQSENVFRITGDGICYGYLRKLTELRDLGFAREIRLDTIPFYRDTLSVRDLDDLFHFQLVEHTVYLFKREEFSITPEFFVRDRKYDLLVEKAGRRYIVEIKKGTVLESFDHLKDHLGANASVLITTASVSDEDIRYAEGLEIVIIDRRRLRAIIKYGKRISDFLERLKV